MAFLRLAIFVTFLLILSLFAFRRNHIWGDSMSFWGDVVNKSPNKARANNNLGYALIGKNRCDDAMHFLLLSLKADPWYIEPNYNIALCHIKSGRFDDAVPKLEEVLRINTVLSKGHYGERAVPRYELQAHSNLGNIYSLKGLYDKAVYHYKEALKISPDDASTRFNLAITYETMGMLKEARAEFEEVLRINPLDEGARRGIRRLQTGGL